MKSRMLAWIAVVNVFTLLAMPVRVLAQQQQQQGQHLSHYIVTDLGTLEGGTFSQPFFISRYGLVSGSSSLPDGNQHAVLWLGKLKLDIGAPGLGGPNSIAFGDNDRFRSQSEVADNRSK